MPRIAYIRRSFHASTRAVIDRANAIIAEYLAQGFRLTLRQLFYQFVSRELLANRQSEYKRLGEIVNDARLAGAIDWDAIEDRTRWLRSNTHWSDPEDIIRETAHNFTTDRWRNQDVRPFVLIEKDALIGVIEATCEDNDIPYLACRGYASQSEVWSLAISQLRALEQRGQTPVIFHLGDHDPSGLDMTRDLRERLCLFLGHDLEVRRLALNMDQIAQYQPPPNPAKTEDSRFASYAREFGDESWELDALEPAVIAGLVADAIDDARDDELWSTALTEEQEGRSTLEHLAERWAAVQTFLEDFHDQPAP